MTVATHSIFAGALALLFNMPLAPSMYLIFGSALPDIDHQKSFIGRIFFFISHPINKRFGHRHITHSLVLWVPTLLIGFTLFKPLYYISLGVLTHLFLDCWNMTGLCLFRPISDKVFVMANKKYRIKVGSRSELVLMVFLIFLALGSFEISQKGGFRQIIRDMMGDYNVVLSDYQRAGLELSYIEGQLRGTEGKIRSVKYLIIGNGQGSGHLVLYDEEKRRIVDVPKEGRFIRSVYRKGNGSWSTLQVKEPLEVAEIEGIAFNRARSKWRKLKEGDIVIGDVNYLGKISLR